MRPNYLFLDIDGVLNNNEALEKKRICDFHSAIFSDRPFTVDGFNFVEECLANLKYIIANVTALTIVISSNWRYSTQPHHFLELFDLFDIHPYQLFMIDNTMEENTFFKRSFIISLYLKDLHDKVNYVAVDDRKDLFHSDFTNVVFTDPNKGLTRENADSIIGYLKG